MFSVSKIICPHLKGSDEGAVCLAAKSLIKDLQDVTIKVCMGRHYEICFIYMSELSRERQLSPLDTSLQV